MKHLHLTNRFFLLFGGVALLFVLGYVWGVLFPVALAAFTVAAALVLADVILLFNKNTLVEASRRLPKMLSLGDPNRVFLDIANRSPRPLRLTVVEELPFQFHPPKADEKKLALAARSERAISYELTPVERGEFEFGAANLFAETELGLVQRRFRSAAEQRVPVFPSVPQMKRYEQLAFQRTNSQQGLRKIRRIGHSYEFEQIKNYVPGDDYRSLNWKATGRLSRLMSNQYEDERSQQVYCILDKSRVMKMPFAGLSLLDHAINASLAVSNIALKKYDKAGLISFSDKIGSTIKADRKADQLHRILHALHKEQERHLEANWELLYHIARKLVGGRSLLLLFTNFESASALDRALPTLRRINHLHLLVVIFFINTEMEDFAKREAATVEEIYTQAVAQKFLADKAAMAQKLRQHGIQAVLTRPEELSMNTIAKFLELKSRGMI